MNKVRSNKINISRNYLVDLSSVSLDAEVIAGMSDDIVKSAKQMKADNGDRYTDEQYIEFANNQKLNSKNQIKLNNVFSSLASHSGVLLQCLQIPDPEWAQYTYEEILEMEENTSIVIPEEVLAWAHSQQEMDDTAYTITSDDIDSLCINEFDPDSNSQFLPFAKSLLKKSEVAQKKCNNDISAYKELKEEVLALKSKKNDSEMDLNGLKTLTSEWKQLDNKRKDGKLSSWEEMRYNRIKGQIKAQNKEQDLKNLSINEKILKDFSGVVARLDESLKVCDFLNAQSNDVAVSMNSLRQDYFMDKKDYSGIEIYSTGGVHSISEISNTLSVSLSVMDSSYSFIKAEKEDRTVKDSNETSDYNTSDEVFKDSVKIANSDEKTESMQNNNDKKTENNSNKDNNVQNNDSEDSEKSNEVLEDEYGKNKKMYIPITGDPLADSISATAVTALSLSNLEKNNKVVLDTSRTVVQNDSVSAKSVKKFEIAAKEAEVMRKSNLKKSDTNNSKINQLRNEIDEIKENNDIKIQEIEEQMSKEVSVLEESSNLNEFSNAKDSEKSNALASSESEMPAENEVKSFDQVKQDENIVSSQKQEDELKVFEKENAKNQNNDLKNEKNVVQSEKLAVKNVNMLNKNDKLLNKQNLQLMEQNNNNRLVSKSAIGIGANATVVGTMGINIGTSMKISGQAMLPYPPTAAEGAALIAGGTAVFTVGQLQLKAGLSSVLIGSGGVSESERVDDSTSNVKEQVDANSKKLKVEKNILKTYGGKTTNAIRNNSLSSNDLNSSENSSNVQNKIGSEQNMSFAFSTQESSNNTTGGMQNSKSLNNSDDNDLRNKSIDDKTSKNDKKEVVNSKSVAPTPLKNDFDVDEDKNLNNSVDVNNVVDVAKIPEEKPENSNSNIAMNKEDSGKKYSNPFTNNIFEVTNNSITDKEKAFDFDAQKEENSIWTISGNNISDEVLRSAAANSNVNIFADIDSTDKQDNKLDKYNKETAEFEKQKDKRVKKVNAIIANKKQR